MFGKTETPELDRKFRAAERYIRFPRVALRQRSNDHPMIMFALLVSAAFVSMALMMPASGAVLAKPDGAPAKIAEKFGGAGKTFRLAPMSETDRLCRGQAWGSQSEACLVAIARESGKIVTSKVRMIANAEPLRTTPNMF